MTNIDTDFILPQENKWENHTLSYTIWNTSSSFSAYSWNPITRARYIATGWDPDIGLFVLSKDSSPNALDQQDIVRFLLLSPASIPGLSLDRTLSKYLLGAAVNPYNDENYRVSFPDVAVLSFFEADSAGDITLALGFSPSSTKRGLAWLPDDLGDNGDVFVNSNVPELNQGFEFGTESFFVWLHELGHAIGGLTHPTDPSRDNQKFSIMSYNEYRQSFAHGLQLFDILALQTNYGNRNFGTRAGDTEYSLKAGFGLDSWNPGADIPFVYSIWDGGGVDGIDAQEYNVPAQIDLRSGRFSSIGLSGVGAPVPFDGEAGGFDADAGNVSISFYTVIENAIGSSLGDYIIGNAWNNHLEGGDGNDHLYGDGVVYDNDPGFLGVDEDTSLDSDGDGDAANDFVDPMRPWGPNNVKYDANLSGDDALDGGAGDDILVGGAGSDTLSGGAGMDVFLGTAPDLNGDAIVDLEVGDRIFVQKEILNQSDVSFDAAKVYVANTAALSGAAQSVVEIAATVPTGAALLVKPRVVDLDGYLGTEIEVVAEPKLYMTDPKKGIYEVFSPGAYAQLTSDGAARGLTIGQSGNLISAVGTTVWLGEIIPGYIWNTPPYDFNGAVQTTEIDPATGQTIAVVRYLGDHSLFPTIFAVEYLPGSGLFAFGEHAGPLYPGSDVYLALNPGVSPYSGWQLSGNFVGTATFIQNMRGYPQLPSGDYNGMLGGVFDTAVSPSGDLYAIASNRGLYSQLNMPVVAPGNLLILLEKHRVEPAVYDVPLYQEIAPLPADISFTAITFSSDGALFGYGQRDTGERGLYEIGIASGQTTYLGDFLTGPTLEMGDFVFTGTAAELRAMFGFAGPGQSASAPPSAPGILFAGTLAVSGFGGTLAGLAGNTQLTGSDGDDDLSDLDGNNQLLGQAGNDRLTTGAGIDVLLGGTGNDTLMSGDGDDYDDGGDGDDDIQSGAGNDTVIAGAGNDLVDAGDGDDSVWSGSGTLDLITLGAGADRLLGALSDLIGDQVSDFSGADEIVFVGSALSRTQIAVQSGSAILVIDTDGDGSPEGSITLEGDFSGGDFMAVADAGDTTVTFETFLPALAERQAVDPALVNGIVNQAFLRGDGNTDFVVTLRDLGHAGYNNALGVYEVDASGAILDPRILFTNANTDKSAQALISSVEDGNRLGFFIVQDAAAWAQSLSATDRLSFIDAGGAAADLSDGSAVGLAVNGLAVNETVFHSIARSLNRDGMEHALSGVDPGGLSITVGFEDLTGGGDMDYEDVAFRIEAVQAGSYMIA